MHPRLQKAITGSRFAGVEVEFAAEGTRFHLALMKRKGTRVLLEKTAAAITEFEALEKILPKDIPLTLAFTGKGILHRRIAADPSSDVKTLLAKILSNAAIKDFYLQSVPAAGDELFVSVVRKNAADLIFGQFRQHAYSVTGCTLGPLCIVNIISLLGGQHDEIICGRHRLVLQDGLPEDVSYSDDAAEASVLRAGDQPVDNISLLSFAAAFQQLLAQERRAEPYTDALAEARENFFQKKLFRAAVVSTVAFLLAALFGNYFVFSHYWGLKNDLESRLQTEGSAFTEVRTLEKQVHAKRDFLSQAGLLGPAHHSYFADQLAAALPNEILLTRMSIAPKIKLQDDDSIAFTPRHIEIEGSCTQSVVLNSWLENLKEAKWVKSARIESYVQDKAMSSGVFSIALETE